MRNKIVRGIQMIQSRGWLFAGVGLILNACSGSPEPQEFPAAAVPAEELKKLDADLEKAVARQVDVLAPANYEDAREAYDEANRESRDGSEASEILESIGESRAFLAKAEERANKARSAISEVAEARERANKAGAGKHFARELEKADDGLESLTSDIEDGDSSDVAAKRGQLLQTYLDLELQSIKEARLGEARRTLQQARNEGAEELAPQTLRAADKMVADADAYIVANRTKTSEVAAQSGAALEESQRVLRITQEAKAHRGSSPEEIALRMEQEEKLVQQKQAELKKQQMESKQLASETRGLKEEQEFNRKLQAVRKDFNPDEAEVFQQGESVLLRLKGLEFPSGQAVLKGENFALLTKVQKVIREFGQSRVSVEGHTDDRGGQAANEKLSRERAQAVADYLVSTGVIDRAKLSVQGYGFSKPIASNKSEMGRAQNRRVDVIVTPDRGLAAVD